MRFEESIKWDFKDFKTILMLFDVCVFHFWFIKVILQLRIISFAFRL